MVDLEKKQKYLNSIRKCGTIISKTDGSLQIMDSTSFKTLKAEIDEKLMGKAKINDQVTYVQSDGKVKVLEVRDQ